MEDNLIIKRYAQSCIEIKDENFLFFVDPSFYEIPNNLAMDDTIFITPSPFVM